MKIDDGILIFEKLGEKLSEYLVNGFPEDFEEAILQSQLNNPWFTRENMLLCLEYWAKTLTREKLSKWLAPHKVAIRNTNPKKIAVIMAGNVPLVAFHDFLCVIISGHSIIGKLSSQDRFLLPAITKEWISIDSSLNDAIILTEEPISGFDAVIATGSDNSSNYFNYYFGKYPHIIRKNRNSVAIITGNETGKDLELLADDVFQYFGLGCRNVTKVYVPAGYNFTSLKEAFMNYSDRILLHNKYLNNYDYHKSIMLINSIPFLDFDFIMLKEDTRTSSPISVLHYEYYDDEENVLGKINCELDKIQCIVANERYTENTVPFGKSQSPELWDYADGVDTMRFLLSLKYE